MSVRWPLHLTLVCESNLKLATTQIYLNLKFERVYALEPAQLWSLRIIMWIACLVRDGDASIHSEGLDSGSIEAEGSATILIKIFSTLGWKLRWSAVKTRSRPY